MADIKASILPLPAEKASQLDREIRVQNSVRVAQGKAALSQEEFIAAILSGLLKRPFWIKTLLKRADV